MQITYLSPLKASLLLSALLRNKLDNIKGCLLCYNSWVPFIVASEMVGKIGTDDPNK